MSEPLILRPALIVGASLWEKIPSLERQGGDTPGIYGMSDGDIFAYVGEGARMIWRISEELSGWASSNIFFKCVRPGRRGHDAWEELLERWSVWLLARVEEEKARKENWLLCLMTRIILCPSRSASGTAIATLRRSLSMACGAVTTNGWPTKAGGPTTSKIDRHGDPPLETNLSHAVDPAESLHQRFSVSFGHRGIGWVTIGRKGIRETLDLVPGVYVSEEQRWDEFKNDDLDDDDASVDLGKHQKV